MSRWRRSSSSRFTDCNSCKIAGHDRNVIRNLQKRQRAHRRNVRVGDEERVAGTRGPMRDWTKAYTLSDVRPMRSTLDRPMPCIADTVMPFRFERRRQAPVRVVSVRRHDGDTRRAGIAQGLEGRSARRRSLPSRSTRAIRSPILRSRSSRPDSAVSAPQSKTTMCGTTAASALAAGMTKRSRSSSSASRGLGEIRRVHPADVQRRVVREAAIAIHLHHGVRRRNQQSDSPAHRVPARSRKPADSRLFLLPEQVEDRAPASPACPSRGRRRRRRSR